MMPESTIVQLSKDTADIDAILSGITHVHASCIEYDKTLATFLPPLCYDRMLQWWRECLDEITAGCRHIWVELAPVSSRKGQFASPFKDTEQKPICIEQDPDQEYEVSGVVALAMPVSETGPFRGEVHKLLVSPNHRQKGIARSLMAALEQGALKEGRWNLMLDTEVGSPAEKVYPRFGYIRVGVVPQYGYSPAKGYMPDEVWFYKDLGQGTL